jgi:hypothetical protein
MEGKNSFGFFGFILGGPGDTLGRPVEVYTLTYLPSAAQPKKGKTATF